MALIYQTAIANIKVTVRARVGLAGMEYGIRRTIDDKEDMVSYSYSRARAIELADWILQDACDIIECACAEVAPV